MARNFRPEIDCVKSSYKIRYSPPFSTNLQPYWNLPHFYICLCEEVLLNMKIAAGNRNKASLQKKPQFRVISPYELASLSWFSK